MPKFSASREPFFTPFIQYRIASDRWNSVSESQLIYFDRYCTSRYPEVCGISQAMVDGWCGKRGTEVNASCYTRIIVIVALIHYLRERGMTNIQIPVVPTYKKQKHIPNALDPEDLRRFFRGCDKWGPSKNARNKKGKAMVASVVFRLLYSSGLRPVEARWLKVENVDLNTGVLDIQYSKSLFRNFN